MSVSLLVPLDGSAIALHAIDWVIATLPQWREAPAVHLLNVQASLHGDIGRFVSATQLAAYHRDAGEQALAEGVARLTAAGIAPQCHVVVGDAAPCIIDIAQREGCTQLVVGARGHGAVAGMLLGSVAQKLVNHAPLPLTVVR